MNNINLLKKAINLAYFAHEGQLDKGGSPYILHPIRVMVCCETIEEKIVAVLHDVLEDTKVTYQELINLGLNDKILEALLAITKEKDEYYIDFIKRVKNNKLATKVKIQDIIDNLDETRLNGKKHWKSDLYNKALEILKEN